MSSRTNMITQKPQDVYEILYKALERLILNRISDRAFTDQEDVISKGYFSTLEGLEALLIPFVNLPKNMFWDPLRQRYKELPEIISEDIDFVLSHNKKEAVPPKEQGTPYFEQGKGIRLTPYWTSECASFSLSVLTNYLMLCEKVGLKGVPSERIARVIKTNLQWINLCKRDFGWSWTTDSPSHPWPTWSILDTFEEMLNCDLLTDLHDLISPEFTPILNKIIESFQTNVVGSYMSNWEEKVVGSRPYDVEAALDLSRLMLAVSLHSNRKVIKPLARKLYAWASETDFENVDYNYHLQPKSDYIVDSSLVPSVLRTLIIMAGVLKFKGVSDIEKSIGQSHEVVVNRVYSHLMKNQITHGRFKDLWGVSSQGLKYELYYTERTIEALTEFLVHYEPDYSVIPVTDVPKSLNAAQEISSGISIASSVQVAPAYLPILEEIARSVRKKHGPEVFKDVIVIFVLHFLNDLIPLVEQFESLGCIPQDMYFLVKTYDYPEKQQLIKLFQKKHCQVYNPPDATEKTFFDQVSKILTSSLEKCSSENKKILIVEDGGYFAPLFHSAGFSADIPKCYGAVEQTTKGYRRDSGINDPQFPIISIATSKLKLFLEAQEVAETLQENIVSTLRKYNSDKPLNMHKVLILGFGNIGQKLSEGLANRSMKVSIYDSDPFKRMQAELSNYNVLDNLDDLRGFHIIIGVSGEPSLKEGPAFWTLDHNVILASGSSERLEFDVDSLANISVGITREEIFTKYTLKKDNKVIRLMCDGEPINFALSEGIAKSIIDPIYAEMFVAAIRIVENDGLGNGLQDLPRESEEEVLKVFKTYHRT